MENKPTEPEDQIQKIHHTHRYKGFVTFFMIREILCLLLGIGVIYAADRYFDDKYRDGRIEALESRLATQEENMNQMAIYLTITQSQNSGLFGNGSKSLPNMDNLFEKSVKKKQEKEAD